MSIILEVKNFTKIYSKKENRGVNNISFSVKQGSFHAFIGENGSGKTTTIKSIIGSIIGNSGTILINGIDNKKPESKKKIGYVPENAIFPPNLTTYEYLFFLSKINGEKEKIINEKINKFLIKLNILYLKNQKPYRFSSGQKKKVSLIQALINDPEIILLDEPASNLDPTSRYELFNILKSLNKKGKTVFISSHILSEIDKYTDSLTLIDKGKIIYNGTKINSLEKIYYDKIIQNKKKL